MPREANRHPEGRTAAMCNYYCDCCDIFKDTGTSTTQLAQAQGIMDLPHGPIEPEQRHRPRRRGQDPL